MKISDSFIKRARIQAANVTGQTNKALQSLGITFVLRYKCNKCGKEFEHINEAADCRKTHE